MLLPSGAGTGVIVMRLCRRPARNHSARHVDLNPPSCARRQPTERGGSRCGIVKILSGDGGIPAGDVMASGTLTLAQGTMSNFAILGGTGIYATGRGDASAVLGNWRRSSSICGVQMFEFQSSIRSSATRAGSAWWEVLRWWMPSKTTSRRLGKISASRFAERS